MGKLAGFVLGLLGTVPRIWAQDPNGSPQTNGPPGWMIGDFEDDYGNRFRVGADRDGPLSLGILLHGLSGRQPDRCHQHAGGSDYLTPRWLQRVPLLADETGRTPG
mgnify:CR=1 FL=1